MTKASSLTMRLLAGVVALFGVFVASNARAETPPATSIKKVWLPLGLTSIDGNSFRNLPNLELVEPLIPDGVTYLGDRVFNNDYKLTGTLKLGGNGQNVSFFVPSGGGYHFGSCAITNIIVGAGITHLATRVFYACRSVREVEFLGYATWDSTAFGGGAKAGTWNDQQARFVIPLVNSEWDNYLQTAFAPNLWVFLWNPKPNGMTVIFG